MRMIDNDICSELTPILREGDRWSVQRGNQVGELKFQFQNIFANNDNLKIVCFR